MKEDIWEDTRTRGELTFGFLIDSITDWQQLYYILKDDVNSAGLEIQDVKFRVIPPRQSARVDVCGEVGRIIWWKI